MALHALSGHEGVEGGLLYVLTVCVGSVSLDDLLIVR